MSRICLGGEPWGSWHCISAMPEPVGCTCMSCSPGSTVLPLRSITLALDPGAAFNPSPRSRITPLRTAMELTQPDGV